MSSRCALIGSLEASSWSLTLQVTASPLRTITIADGEWWALDLLEEIEDQATAHAELAAFTARLVDGRVVLTLPASCTLTWTSTELRDALRFSGATLAATATGSAQMRGVFSPAAGRINDRPTPANTASVLRGITTADVHTYGTRPERQIALRFSGHQRSGAADEWRAARLFWGDYMGADVRWYPDVTVADAFNEDAHPYGYHSLRLLEPQTWDPSLVVQGYFGLWRLDITAVEV